MSGRCSSSRTVLREESPTSITSPASSSYMPSRSEVSGSLNTERWRLRRLRDTLQADIERADRVLQQMDQVLSPAATPATARSSACSRWPSTSPTPTSNSGTGPNSASCSRLPSGTQAALGGSAATSASASGQWVAVSPPGAVGQLPAAANAGVLLLPGVVAVGSTAPGPSANAVVATAGGNPQEPDGVSASAAAALAVAAGATSHWADMSDHVNLESGASSVQQKAALDAIEQAVADLEASDEVTSGRDAATPAAASITVEAGTESGAPSPTERRHHNTVGTGSASTTLPGSERASRSSSLYMPMSVRSMRRGVPDTVHETCGVSPLRCRSASPSPTASKRLAWHGTPSSSGVVSPQQPGPFASRPRPLKSQLCVALKEALAAGLAAGLNVPDHDIMERAEAMVAAFEAREAAVRSSLRRALSEAEDFASTARSLNDLRELKARLIRGLAAAEDLGLPENELLIAERWLRRVHNAIEDQKGQLRVFCRIRPLNDRERTAGEVEAVQALNGMTVNVRSGGSFSFDSVFAPGSQEEVFEECRGLIQSAIDGHNVTIFAYGQTGAGKTHTMYGNALEEGIAGRAIDELFDLLESVGDRYSAMVTGSMVELYNNQVVDLLRPMRRGAVQPTISVVSARRSSPDFAGYRGQPSAGRVVEQAVRSRAELRTLLDHGIAQRTVAANAINIESSRSHLIFTIGIASTNRETRDTARGKILLCDLGGSERLKKTESTGKRKTEAIEINKSLTALADVIAAVARRQLQVPYRHHKLTQILQDSLGGTAKTLMLVNCSPALGNVQETMMSLAYAARVKKITNSGMPSRSRPPSLSRPGSPGRGRSCEDFGDRGRQLYSVSSSPMCRPRFDPV